MSAGVRDLKEEAVRLLEKGRYRDAARLYDEIATRDEEPDTQRRAADAWLKAGDKRAALSRLELAVHGYRTGGFLSKAIAVAKVMLSVEPRDGVAQRLLQEMQAEETAVGHQRILTPMPPRRS